MIVLHRAADAGTLIKWTGTDLEYQYKRYLLASDHKELGGPSTETASSTICLAVDRGPDNMNPTVGQDGRFANSPSETRPLRWVGRSAASTSRPATTLTISAAYSGTGSSEECRGGSFPGMRVAPAYCAGAARGFRAGGCAAVIRLGSRFASVTHSLWRGRTHRGRGPDAPNPPHAVRSAPTGRSNQDCSRIPIASTPGLGNWKSLTFSTGQRSCPLVTATTVRNSASSRKNGVEPAEWTCEMCAELPAIEQRE